MEEEDIKKQRDELVARAKNEIDKLKSKIADFEENILPGPSKSGIFFHRMVTSTSLSISIFSLVRLCFIAMETWREGSYILPIMCMVGLTISLYGVITYYDNRMK